jgi:chromosome segregation ATPase
VPTLEARVEVLEKESTQMRDEWQVTQRVIQGQAGLLNALRETQLEQGKILQEHSETLKEHGEILKEHSTILKEHSTILKEHSTILKEHSETLNRHEGILDEFHEFRDEVRLGFAGIAQSLDYLIEQDRKSRS